MFKPAVSKRVLLFLAGFVWFCVGAMLLGLAFFWLRELSIKNSFMFFGLGVVAGLLVHCFGFHRIADKNIERILRMDGKKCIFAFISWKSYIVIILMVAIGRLLRCSTVSRQYLAVLYVVMGLALILSATRYLRVFIKKHRV